MPNETKEEFLKEIEEASETIYYDDENSHSPSDGEITIRLLTVISKLLVKIVFKDDIDTTSASRAVILISSALMRKFSNTGDLVVVHPTNTGRVFGYVVSPTFDGMDFPSRQGLIEKALSGLEPETRGFITIILSMTSEEANEE